MRICPTTRDEADSLALSSRNVKLSTSGRIFAPVLHRALVAAKDSWEAGSSKDDAIRKALALITQRRSSSEAEGLDVRLDYIQFNDAESFEELGGNVTAATANDAVVVLSGALWVDNTRLIDNLILGDSSAILSTPLDRLSTSPLPSRANQAPLTVRALVSEAHADAIAFMAVDDSKLEDLRKRNIVTATISHPISGVDHRIVTVTGALSSVANAYALIVSKLPRPSLPPPSPSSSPSRASSTSRASSIRLLVPHLLIGRIIGKNGTTLQAIQAASGAQLFAGKTMLPNSTERIVEVRGSPASVAAAIKEITEALLGWWAGPTTIFYQPGTDETPADTDTRSIQTKTILVPSSSRGVIVGTGGASIQAIESESGTSVSTEPKTQKEANEVDELKVTIIGTTEGIECAVRMINSLVQPAPALETADPQADEDEERFRS